MGRKKRDSDRPSNKYIYFIVEGCTEENYLKLLKIIYRQGIQIKNIKGGSAKKVLEEAKKIIKNTSDEYKGYVIWFDRDTYDNSRDVDLLTSLKSQDNVEIYISNPCIENWLLAHFQKINKNELKCAKCLRVLKEKYIKNYKKNDCNMLTKFITEIEIGIAISNYSELQGIPKIVEKNQLLKYQT